MATFFHKPLRTVTLKDKSIVFFDGICGLCNSFVDIVIKLDFQKKLKFSPLQGETASQICPSEKIAEMKTILFFRDGKVFHKSKAVIEIFITLGGLGRLALLGRLVPSFLLDILYDLVAKYRYKIFGTQDCRIPSPEEKQRFLP